MRNLQKNIFIQTHCRCYNCCLFLKKVLKNLNICYYSIFFCSGSFTCIANIFLDIYILMTNSIIFLWAITLGIFELPIKCKRQPILLNLMWNMLKWKYLLKIQNYFCWNMHVLAKFNTSHFCFGNIFDKFSETVVVKWTSNFIKKAYIW